MPVHVAQKEPAQAVARASTQQWCSVRFCSNGAGSQTAPACPHMVHVAQEGPAPAVPQGKHYEEGFYNAFPLLDLS